VNGAAAPSTSICDVVSVSATWYCTDPSFVSDRIRNAADKITNVRDGSVAVSLGTVRSEDVDSSLRQASFETACSSLVTKLSRAGIDGAFLRKTTSSVTLRITLEPIDGTAGIVLHTELLSPWIALNADIDLNAYSS
jgi:hypothetical protein